MAGLNKMAIDNINGSISCLKKAIFFKGKGNFPKRQFLLKKEERKRKFSLKEKAIIAKGKGKVFLMEKAVFAKGKGIFFNSKGQFF